MNNMTKVLLVLGLAVLISLPVLGALKSGDKAPVFSAPASLAAILSGRWPNAATVFVWPAADLISRAMCSP